MTPRAILVELFLAAVAAAQPATCMRAAVAQVPPPRGRTIVIGAGKAAAYMAAALEAMWPTPVEGVVVTRYGHATACRQIQVLQAGHPQPDQNSLDAAQAMRRQLTGLTKDDLVISLISGGGSALLVEPVAGITLADKQQVTQAMFQAGATIRQLNRVRQALSLVKGGGLAAMAWPAQVLTLVISDVPGDDPAFIASGPTVPPPAESASPLEIITRLGLRLPPHVLAVLAQPSRYARQDFSHCRTMTIATPIQSLQAAAARARELGYVPMILSDCIEAEAAEAAQVHAGIAQSIRRHYTPLAPPAVLLSGGECRVSLGNTPAGKGGRNTEFLLALGLALQEEQGMFALACDTDGIDGSEDNAGALWLPDSVQRARERGLDLPLHLARHDSYAAFAALDDLVITGPTRTNVNDFRAILIH
ncbi:glycerate kinase [Janthinobacterium sp. 17J80-10]|uniref:glycerate kinase type-2 family protein n=1 Tax=Janthinobacterium sp. 17J80-10 TaxID=2497863 RepID=UPI0010059EC9|nr:glycerate kinase [Janthinobacterium sp. 17J80-10]QAU36132.1 glycerate kinase [Janthinobacterium sp. 17J80-10]